MKKCNIYVDMDGVLAEWNANASVEDTFERGYFLNRIPDRKMVNLVKALINDGMNVVVLSHAYENGYASFEKNQWLDAHVSRSVSRIFVPYGIPKNNYVIFTQNVPNILIDDFTKNLRSWEKTGSNFIGLKYYNGINGNHGTWDGASINKYMTPVMMKSEVYALLDEN